MTKLSAYIYPRFTNCHDNAKIVYHRRTLNKMEWIYTSTKMRGRSSLELGLEEMKETLTHFALFFYNFKNSWFEHT